MPLTVVLGAPGAGPALPGPARERGRLTRSSLDPAEGPGPSVRAGEAGGEGVARRGVRGREGATGEAQGGRREIERVRDERRGEPERHIREGDRTPGEWRRTGGAGPGQNGHQGSPRGDRSSHGD